MIVELTKLVISATTYIDAATAQLGEGPLPTKETPDAPAKAPTKRTRTRKAAPVATEVSPQTPTPVQEAPAEPAAASGLTEEQSATEVLVVAKAYVQRFMKASPDGMTRARDILSGVYDAGKIGDLSHEERLTFIARMTEEMKVGV